MDQKAQKLLRELVKRTQSKVNVLEKALPQQIKFINSKTKLKAILATRRASKSYTAGLYLFKEALENPGVSCLYLALTRGSAKKIMVKDVLNVINREYQIGAKFNQVDLSYTLPNGSIIYLLGADSREEEKEKLLGQKYKLAVIDEAASFKQDLRDLIYKVLKPAMIDLDGTIIMIGTPGNNTKTLFYDVTTGKEKGWDVYKWKAADNPFVADQIHKEMKSLIKNNPLIVDTPLWKQMYLGEWAIETDKLVYKYNSDKNLIDQLPDSKAPYKYVLGVDLGYEDASAFTVVCYNEHDRTMYIVESYKKSQMDFTEVAEYIKKLAKKYTIYKYIVDGASKQGVEEMRNRHSIPFEKAEKRGKLEYIELMNGELIQGNIKLIEDDNEDLIEEWQTLVWDDRGAKRQENSACPNHLCDSTLYAWRACYNYVSKAPKDTPPPSSEAAIDEFWERESERLTQDVKPFWERDF